MLVEKYQTNKKELLFQIEESKDDITILQTGKIWCDECYTWVDEVELNDMKNYICCSACGNGLVMLT